MIPNFNSTTVALTAIAIDPTRVNFVFNIGRISLRAREALGIQGSTGKWVSNVVLISITFSLVNPPPAARSEIALR